jgi:hypothetical protein
MAGEASMGKTEAVDRDYLELESRALELTKKAQTPDELAKSTESLKNIKEARNFARNTNFQHNLSVLSAVTPLLALFATIYSYHSQASQFQQTLSEQRRGSVDAQWRDALKLVSFTDPHSSGVGALAMLSFFGTDHGPEAVTIASSLLPNVSNVGIFDKVLAAIRDKTAEDNNFANISSVARALGMAQRAKYHIAGAASKENTPFLMETVDAFYLDPKSIEDDPRQQLNVSAWDLDTTSQFLKDLWKTHGKPSADHKPLTGIVLENAHTDYDNFDGLDFSYSDLSFAILTNANFKRAKFVGANLSGAYVQKVDLTDADFRSVTSFEGSRWEQSNWWDAKCVPSKMMDYLVHVSPPPPDALNKVSALRQSGCK